MTTTNVKQIACYLKPAQIAKLKKLSATTGAPVQHYLRLAVDQFLAKKKPARRRA
jgi:Ribbon-helix-helix domain